MAKMVEEEEPKNVGSAWSDQLHQMLGNQSCTALFSILPCLSLVQAKMANRKSPG
jgi:hypothetical protein